MDDMSQRKICGVEITAINDKLGVELAALEKFGIVMNDADGSSEEFKRDLELLDCPDGLHMPDNENYTSLYTFFILLLMKTSLTKCKDRDLASFKIFLKELFQVYLTSLEAKWFGIADNANIDIPAPTVQMDMPFMTHSVIDSGIVVKEEPLSYDVDYVPDEINDESGDDDDDDDDDYEGGGYDDNDPDFIPRQTRTKRQGRKQSNSDEDSHEDDWQTEANSDEDFSDDNLEEENKEINNEIVKPAATNRKRPGPKPKIKRTRFECEECGKDFKMIGNLNRHRSVHSEERPFECDQCEKKFKTKEILHKHKKLHLGKKYSCEKCSKLFHTKTYLRIHMAVHAKELVRDVSEVELKAPKPIMKEHESGKRTLRTYICPECGKSFTGIGRLNRHKSVHTSVRPFACNACGMRFKDKDVLRKHEKFIHLLADAQHPCQVCNKIFRTQTLLRGHMAVHAKDKPFECDICGLRFVRKYDIKKHKRSKHFDETQMIHKFVCNICNIEFLSETFLENHMIRHGIGEDNDSLEKYENSPQERDTDKLQAIIKTEEGEQIFECPECGKQFSSVSKFNIHKVVHSEERPYGCEKCGKWFKTKITLTNHRYVHIEKEPEVEKEDCQLEPIIRIENGEKIVKCPVCGKLFPGVGKFNSHKTVHTTERPFICEICGKFFKTKITLQKHSLLHGERNIPCPECGKMFPTEFSLKAHMPAHADENTHLCEECGMGFKRKENLNMHLLVHQGLDESKCPECGKTFANPGSLKGHIRTVHAKEKPFQCVTCGVCFVNKAGLKVHSIVHTGEKPHQCTVCGKSFGIKATLTYHMKIHTGEKPFPCLECGKSFRDRRNYNIHRFTHTDFRPHPCVICGKSFLRKHQVRRHMRFHTAPSDSNNPKSEMTNEVQMNTNNNEQYSQSILPSNADTSYM